LKPRVAKDKKQLEQGTKKKKKQKKAEKKSKIQEEPTKKRKMQEEIVKAIEVVCVDIDNNNITFSERVDDPLVKLSSSQVVNSQISAIAKEAKRLKKECGILEKECRTKTKRQGGVLERQEEIIAKKARLESELDELKQEEITSAAQIDVSNAELTDIKHKQKLCSDKTAELVDLCNEVSSDAAHASAYAAHAAIGRGDCTAYAAASAAHAAIGRGDITAPFDKGPAWEKVCSDHKALQE